MKIYPSSSWSYSSSCPLPEVMQKCAGDPPLCHLMMDKRQFSSFYSLLVETNALFSYLAVLEERRLQSFLLCVIRLFRGRQD